MIQPLTKAELSALIGEWEAARDYAAQAAQWFHGPGGNSEGARAFMHLEAMIRVGRRVLFAEVTGEMYRVLHNDTRCDATQPGHPGGNGAAGNGAGTPGDGG